MKLNKLNVNWAGLFLLALILFIIFSNPALAEAKNYYFPEVRVEIHIEQDGSFLVDEYRTYDFEGRFSWAIYSLVLRSSRPGYDYNLDIEDFQVLDEEGRTLRSEILSSNEKFEAKWYYLARNERRNL